MCGSTNTVSLVFIFRVTHVSLGRTSPAELFILQRSDVCVVLKTVSLSVSVRHSSYKRALRQIKSKEYGEIIKLCTDEINMTSSTHMAEALLLRATFYLLRSEMNSAMEDFEQLLAMDGVDKHVSYLKLIGAGT